MSEGLIMPTDRDMGGGSSSIPEGNLEEGTGKEVVFYEVESGISTKDNPFVKAHAHYIDDDFAKGYIYCALHQQIGLEKLVNIVCRSGVAERMKKNGSMKKDPLKGIPASVLLSSRFHEQLNISLPGCRVLATITHQAVEFPDKETGKPVQYTKSVIGDIAAIGSVANKPVTNIPGSVTVPEKPVSTDDDWFKV